MAQNNRNNRYQDNDYRSSWNNDYDRDRNYDDWDRNYNNRNKDNDRYSDYRGYNNGNRNVYSSDRDRDYWNNQNEQRNDRSYNRPDSSYMDKDYGQRNDWSGTRYGNNYYNERDRNEGWRNNDRNEGRDWWDKTKDEVSSWFGDDDARRRRRIDEIREGRHKGKGPKNYTRSNERIKEDASDRLSDDSLVDASNIEIEVVGNELTLSGTVSSRYEKRRAEDLVENVSGVRNVQNNLRVIPDSTTDVYGKSDFGTNTDTSGTLYGGVQNRE